MHLWNTTIGNSEDGTRKAGEETTSYSLRNLVMGAILSFVVSNV